MLLLANYNGDVDGFVYITGRHKHKIGTELLIPKTFVTRQDVNPEPHGEPNATGVGVRASECLFGKAAVQKEY
jgi:hypothetical protein